MFVYSVLLSVSLLALAGAPWWVVPIGAVLLLSENRDEISSITSGSTLPGRVNAISLSVGMKLVRNMVFVALSFGIGLFAGWLFGVDSK
jgi:hypothetical protein